MAEASPQWLSTFQPTYVPVPPISQYKGTDPKENVLTYYQIDINGFIVNRYDAASDSWQGYIDYGPFAMPADIQPAIGLSDADAIATSLATSGRFKQKTAYIIVGDEPVGGEGVLDLTSMLTSDQITQLTQFMQIMPRSFLREWFTENVAPSLPLSNFVVGSPANAAINAIYGSSDTTGGQTAGSQYEDLVWMAFIDIFNTANLAYVTANNLAPWDWETQKSENYFISQSSSAQTEIQTQMSEASDLALSLDPRAIPIMQAYMALPKLGDPGLEINRQNAVKELLRQGEYDSAQVIVDSFQSASSAVLSDVLSSPIPFDIVTGSGVTVVATPSKPPLIQNPPHQA